MLSFRPAQFYFTQFHLRCLLAVLTVVAAFAFQARVGGMADMDMTLPVGGQQTNPIARHPSELVRPSPQSSSQSPQPALRHQHSQGQGNQNRGGQSNKESHDHAAHCPFCVTGAFSLEAGVLPVPTAPPHLASQPQPFALTDLPAAPRHADARAPPFLL